MIWRCLPSESQSHWPLLVGQVCQATFLKRWPCPRWETASERVRPRRSAGTARGSAWAAGSADSSKEKGGSGAHDHSRHKITIHSKFPRHKITLKNQQFYLSIFYSSPPTKHATRHNFQLNHSNSCKLHQNDFHTTKVDSGAHQTPSIYISLWRTSNAI